MLRVAQSVGDVRQQCEYANPSISVLQTPADTFRTYDGSEPYSVTIAALPIAHPREQERARFCVAFFFARGLKVERKACVSVRADSALC